MSPDQVSYVVTLETILITLDTIPDQVIWHCRPLIMLTLERSTWKWGWYRRSRRGMTKVPDQVIRHLPDQVISNCQPWPSKATLQLQMMLNNDTCHTGDSTSSGNHVRDYLIMHYLRNDRTTWTWITIHRPDGSAAGKKMSFHQLFDSSLASHASAQAATMQQITVRKQLTKPLL